MASRGVVGGLTRARSRDAPRPAISLELETKPLPSTASRHSPSLTEAVTVARPKPLRPSELDEHLALAAGLTVKGLRVLDPQLAWVPALDENGAEANELMLAY